MIGVRLIYCFPQRIIRRISRNGLFGVMQSTPHQSLMKASVNTRYGAPDVLQLTHVAKPAPGAGEVLVRVCATTVGRTDACALRAHPFFIRLLTGLRRPKRHILGLDFAGIVEATGPDVTLFAPGDRVFGLTPGGYGAHAEYLCIDERASIATMPDGLPFEQAVIGEGAWYADTYLKRFGLGPGHKILIYGASGAIGAAAVQLAKSYGAEVTAVVGTRHVQLARSLGADHVVNYQTEDFTRIDARFDFILDAVGKTTFFRCKKLLKRTGVFSATDLGPWAQNIFLEIWFRLTRRNRVVFPMPKSSKRVIEFIKSRLETGALRAVIDRTYPFEDIADAYRYVETAQKTGIVVIDVQ